MNHQTLKSTLAKLDPNYKIKKSPDTGMHITCNGKTINLADSNSLGRLTVAELRVRLGA